MDQTKRALDYIMFGQMMQKENKHQTIQSILSRYDYLSDPLTLSLASEDIVTKSLPEIDAATLLMQSCICYLLSNRIVQFKYVLGGDRSKAAGVGGRIQKPTCSGIQWKQRGIYGSIP